jgi:dATP pyrophosphohydrolase
MSKRFKIPQSVLVVIFTTALDVLMIRRADSQEDFWQSVTGSKEHPDESFQHTAVREVFEETGIDCNPRAGSVITLTDWHLENIYDIYPRWRHRYPPGVHQNTEHLFGLHVPADTSVTLNPREHTAHKWLPWREAAEHCHSASNAEAILMLPRFIS